MAGSWGALPVGPAMATTEVEEDNDGGPPGGVLPVGPAAATTEVKEDVDGGLPRGRCRRFRQRSPPRFMKTSMAAPLRGSRSHPVSKHTSVPESKEWKAVIVPMEFVSWAPGLRYT
jgi:hypothetical protein